MKTIFDPRYIRLVQFLKQRRRELGLTQARVAREMGRSRTWVNKYEQRERRLDCIELTALGRLLGISPAEIQAILDEEKRP